MNDIEHEQLGPIPGVVAIDEPGTGSVKASVDHRHHRKHRIKLAWGTSLLSKAATIGVQVLAVPLVYRALGQGGYAAYAAVTASAGLIGVLNLGIGGSLVTPIAEAAARRDEPRQTVLVQAGLIPLFLLCLVGSIAVIPIVAFVPLSTLFGRVGATASSDLRIAALIAVSATLAAIPLSAVSYLRQAYQELHISNLIAAGTNLLLLAALLVAARRSTAVAVFVAVFVLIPLSANILNFGLLFGRRRFLLRLDGRAIWEHSRHLLVDGIRYLSASFSNVLVYQWPVYWIVRSLPASASSTFAICMQATILPIGFVLGLFQPLWSSTADAMARADHDWIDRQMRRGRAITIAFGCCAFLTMLLFGERLLHLWLRKPVALDWPVRGLMGAYILLATWENFHFVTALGMGRLREATMAVFQRAIGFAIAVPVLTMTGGVRALWFGMCCSILFWTAWRLPRLLHTQLATKSL
jgi:O-antigen/teichoic acid export membrane protein